MPLAIVFTAAVTAILVTALLSRAVFRVAFWWPIIFVSLPVYFALLYLHTMNRRARMIDPVIADHLQLALPPILITLLLYLTGGNNSSFKMLFLLPVIFYSLHFGLKWGHAVSLYSTLVNFGNYLFCLHRNDTNLRENIFLSAAFFFVQLVHR